MFAIEYKGFKILGNEDYSECIIVGNGIVEWNGGGVCFKSVHAAKIAITKYLYQVNVELISKRLGYAYNDYN